MCEEKGLKRVHFYPNQVLTADALQGTQDYFLEKHRRHNRFIHGWGVVSGLGVSIHGSKAVVQPGLAIDCEGNDLYLGTKNELDLPKEGPVLFVVLNFFEREAGPAADLEDTDSYDWEGTFPIWIQEGCRIFLSEDDPSKGHEPGTPGCGVRHPFSIARLVSGPKGWSVVPFGRPS